MKIMRNERAQTIHITLDERELMEALADYEKRRRLESQLATNPIVHCKDCKWYEWGLIECHNPRYGDGWANYPPPQVYDEYFCKDGERKDEVEE